MANIQTVSFDAPAQPGAQAFASEDEIARQRALAKALREMAAQQQPQIASPAQGFAYLANTAVAGALDRRSQRNADARQQALAQALGGVMGGTPDPQSMATVMALNPELGVRLTQQQREEARQAQQDAMQRQQMEFQRQQAEWQRTRPIEVGGALVDPNTYQPVYSPPAEAPNPMEVSPGATVIDPRTGRPIFQAPAAPQGQEPFTLGPGQTRFGPDGKPIATGQPAAPEPPKFTDVTSARKEFESQPGVSRYRTSAPILASMMQSLDNPAAMSDLDFIYGMAKIFDPTSVVRESEMGLVLQGQSIPQQIQGLWAKAIGGQAVLQGTARRDLIDATRTRVEQYRVQAEQEAAGFTEIAGRYDINPADVVRPLEPMPELPAQPQAPPGGPPATQAPAGQQPAAPGQAFPVDPMRAAPEASLPRITSDADYQALPPGAEYVAPDGSVRRKR